MLIDEIAARLVSRGLGTVWPAPGANIFTGSSANIPAGDGPFLTITETGGSGPTRIQNQDAAVTRRPTVQILVRGKVYGQARLMAEQAFVALDGIFNTELSGTFYLSCIARQEPTDLGTNDGAGRVMISFNLEIERYPS